MVELTSEDLNYFSVFERITMVMPKDYVNMPNMFVFLVDMHDLGRAIGKNGANIKKLTQVFRKKVVIVGDQNDLELFVRSLFNNVTILSIESLNVMGEQNVILTVAEKDRGIAIGKDGERIKAAKEFLKRKFNATISIKTRRTMEM